MLDGYGLRYDLNLNFNVNLFLCSIEPKYNFCIKIETTLGMESNTQSGNNMDFFKAAHNVLEITGKRFFQPWIQPHFLFRISKYFPTFNKSVTIVSSFVNKVSAFRVFLWNSEWIFVLQIVERKTNEINKRKNENNFEENDDDDGMRATHKNIFVSQIIKLSMEDKIFTQYDVTSELKTVLLAVSTANFIWFSILQLVTFLQGYETTATSALSACFLLASYPDVQEKLFEEIHSVFPTQDADVTLEDITNTRMPYLDAVLNECFRFFPVVPFLTRLINEDVVIGMNFDKRNFKLFEHFHIISMFSGDAVIPKGAEVIVDIWGMHRNPSYWKFNASKFNPENFFPENEVPRSKYAFIPFSAGPRICIGKKYGMIAMKLFLIYTVRRFRILTKKQIKDLQFQMQVTIAITNKDIIELELRENY